MARLLAWFFTLLLLLQSFSQEVLVMNYQVNKTRITRRFCVNKARPRLHCNGKCYLARQLRKAAEHDSKAPAAGHGKIKLEVLPATFVRLVAPRWRRCRPVPVRWPRWAASPYAFEWAARQLRPPVRFSYASCF
jgi:hypothetical protein